MAIYQSQHKGEIIDEAVKRVLDILINKTSILPVEVGGTGQTSIAGIKSMLGMDETQYDVQPVNKGGTGATTAANARTNLGITPDNIGAAKSAEHNLKIYTTVTQLGFTAGEATIAGVYSALPSNSMFYGKASDFASGETPSIMGTVKMTKISAARGDITFFSKEVRVEDYRMFLLENGGASGTWYQEYNSYNLGTAIQSLLQGGSISVVKSVQRGSISVPIGKTTTVTITSVNTGKAVVICNNSVTTGRLDGSPSSTTDITYRTISAELTSSTVITFANSGGVSGTAYWQVVEFY